MDRRQKNVIRVLPFESKLQVYHQNYLPEAEKLAKYFEDLAVGDKEFTVEKRY